MSPQIGERFGLLVVLSFDGYVGRRPSVLCQCDCGITRSLSIKSLASGAMRSCGCQSSRRTRKMTHDQQRVDLAEARQQLAQAQAALTDAIQNHDPETITEARHAFTQALARVRTLKDWRVMAELGRGRPQ